ncbi:coiled-coil domain-containing protein 14 [Engraulis encrasicolus]|uniref:coiled-coil domain-containing protein 14 n=1 Tax=Engraulis encrasicolus TaxID=184585 RepID=UPI002FD18556
MASRPALSKHKVISSGRLAITGRGQPVKKKAARLSSRPAAAPEPHYSLYSTDSEDQSTPAKPKPRTAAARREAERKKPLRKATCPSSAASHGSSIAATQKTTTSTLAQPVQRGQQPYCPEGRQPIAEPGLASHDPAGPQVGPPLTPAAQWELMQTQARSSVANQQQLQQQSSGASLQAPSPGQIGSTLFNCRLATSTPVLGPHDTPTSQPAPAMTSSLSDAALQQLAQQWLMASAASHGLLPLAPNAQQHPVTMATAQQQQHPVTMATAQQHPVAMSTTNMAASMAVPNMAAGQQHPVTMATGQQHQVFSSMPESLRVASAPHTAAAPSNMSAPMAPSNMSAPMAPSNMSAPMYTQHSAAVPPQEPQLPQHGSVAPGHGVLPDHPSPSNPTITVNTVPTAGALPSHNNPHVKQNGVAGNPPSDSRAHKLYTTTLPSSSAAAQASQNAPGQSVANQPRPRTPLDGPEYTTSSSSSEDEDVDITPVRDSDSQNGCLDSQNGGGVSRGLADVLKAKALSPQKTARKVMTVKYLLGELKTLVANQDSAAVQLINEVENSISLLPSMVGSTNIQAELALALQPLRSENAQLRRRLRILNQQLMERERAEREARPVDCDMEMTSLQSLNLSLQLQLREAHKETEQVHQENKELRQAVEDKQSQLELSRQQSEAETSRIMMDVSDALAEMRSCQSQLEISVVENAALTTSLQQREAEISRLQQVIRSLQGKLSASSMEHLDASTPDVSKSDSNPNPTPQLRKNLLQQHQQEQQQQQQQHQRTSQRGSEASVSSSSIHHYLQSMEQRRLLSAPISPPRSHRSPPKSPSWPPGRPGDPWGGGGGGGGGGSGSSSLPLERSYSPRRQGTTGAGTGAPAVVAQDDDPYSRPQSSARSERSLDGSSALRSLSQIMERLASVSARGGTPSENGHNVYKSSHHRHDDNTGAPAVFSSVTVTRATTSLPPRTCKEVAMGTGAVGTLARPAVTFTRRASVVNSSLASSPESLASNCSFSSVSTFNTRDEEILRTGMDTLDATIARLQRTLEIDLKR